MVLKKAFHPCGVILLVGVLLLSSCATYYEKNQELMQAVYIGNYELADKLLDAPSSQKPKRNVLLYYLNRGAVNWMWNKPEESNKYFRQADYYIEDFQKNYAAAGLSLITNPNMEPYAGESFEQILLHYYTTLNYVNLGDYDAALIECKRMQQKLQKITDTYKGKNSYKRDAFAHHLLGVIYDAQKDYNSAFIAYRNAFEIYESDYAALGCTAPAQLKQDLMRAAYLTGFSDEVRMYEEKFGMKYIPDAVGSKQVFVFWNNGMGPVKSEWSINFTILPGDYGWVNFVNLDLGLNFPFYVGDAEQSRSLSNLRVIRVAFPKYTSRVAQFSKARLVIDSLNISKELELVEPVEAIAYKSLNDRMLKELGEALLRVALKQVAESQVRKQNEGLGVALSLVNAFSEQADTRNWQFLPQAIHYTRLTLPEGSFELKILITDPTKAGEQELQKMRITPGKSAVRYFQTPQFTGYK